ncbi:IS110 family transposase [Streptomyces poriticola]
MEDSADQDVFGGVDSHADTIHVAVISDKGGHLADAEFATTAAGYTEALAFLNTHGRVTAIGVEGTSSYGVGFTRAARSQGHPVIEVNRPDRAERRRIGKSDPIDAYAAARAALSGRACGVPKDDTVAGKRALHNAARSAVKARTAALNQITNLLVTAPEAIRARYVQLKGTDRTDVRARLRPTGDAVHSAVLTALKSLARRVKEPTPEHEALTRALDRGQRAQPRSASRLRRRPRHRGAAAGHRRRKTRTYADRGILRSPVRRRPGPRLQWQNDPAPSVPGRGPGCQRRSYRIALVRMSSDARTRTYTARQTAAGRTKKEIIRLLKRAIAREIFRCFTTTVTIPGIADLRPLRQAQERHPRGRRPALRGLAHHYLQT